MLYFLGLNTYQNSPFVYYEGIVKVEACLCNGLLKDVQIMNVFALVPFCC